MREEAKVQSEAPTHDADQDGKVDKSRREAILQMAKYTPPVMLAVLLSEKAASASTPP